MQLIPPLGRQHTTGQTTQHTRGDMHRGADTYTGQTCTAEGRHTRTQRKGGLPHCQFAKLQFYGFAFICTAGIKSGELLQFKSRFAESGASAVSTLVQSGFNLAAKVSILLKKQVDKCKNRPLAAKSNLGGNFVQFWFLENKYSGLLIGTRLL